MEVVVKNIISIFTIVDGEVKLLLKDNDIISVYCSDDINVVNEKYIKENLDIKGLKLKQCCTFSEKKDNKLIISILFIDIINYNNINLNDNFNLVSIKELDINKKYIKESLNFLKKELILNSTLKKLYPDEFSLPEIQKIYEETLNKKYDRRNFRKRLIKLDIVEPLEKIGPSKNGRPARLYRLKEIKEERVIF